jgi:hypothetical protein
MEIISDSNRKAKKEHRCSYCNGIIVKGEIYNRQVNVDGGDMWTWKAHLDCNWIANKLDMFDGCDDGLNGEQFREYINEEWHNLQRQIDEEKYESKVFVIPSFFEMLEFMIKYHKENPEIHYNSQ